MRCWQNPVRGWQEVTPTQTMQTVSLKLRVENLNTRSTTLLSIQNSRIQIRGQRWSHTEDQSVSGVMSCPVESRYDMMFSLRGRLFGLHQNVKPICHRFYSPVKLFIFVAFETKFYEPYLMCDWNHCWTYSTATFQQLYWNEVGSHC